MTDEEKFRALAEEISQRNPGGLSVFFKLLDAFAERAIIDYAVLKAMNVLGSDLWDLYKVCGYDIQATHQSIIAQTAIEKLRTVRGSSFWQEGQS